MVNMGFKNAYDAGFDAGMNGANNFNSHFSWFKTKESMKEWQRGNNAGSKKRELEYEHRRRERFKKKNDIIDPDNF